MGAFFTATSMIGFIAGAGIVVRNSIILVDFVELRLKHGMTLIDAVVDAGAVRFRPMMLTAAAVIVGSAIMLADPIFQGLAISLMAGEVASLLLSRMTVPVLFYLSERKKHAGEVGRSEEKTVLVATDFSEQSGVALRYADRIADANGAVLRVLTATQSDLPPYFTQSQLEQISEEERQAETAGIEGIRAFASDKLGEGREIEARFAEDTPTAAILEEIEKADTILVAMGTHGRGGLDKLRFGSVAETVLREARGAVLLAGPSVDVAASVNIDRILCPVDLTPESGSALAYASDLAKKLDAELTVLQVVDEGDVKRVTDKLCEWVPEEARENCSLQEVVRKGDLIAQIAEVREEKNADLIVIGIDHRLFGDETLDEKTFEIIRGSRSPVIAVSRK
jgi:nucleotide-binding universal stress UspA family protein